MVSRSCRALSIIQYNNQRSVAVRRGRRILRSVAVRRGRRTLRIRIKVYLHAEQKTTIISVNIHKLSLVKPESSSRL